MAVAWDPRKASSHFRKHGVRFSDAEGVLLDPGALTRDDATADDEQRFVTLGAGYTGELLVVVHTYREEALA